YWSAFPQLRKDLFTDSDTPYVDLATSEISHAIHQHANVQTFKTQFNTAFANFHDYLKAELIGKMQTLHIAQQENVLSQDIFKRLENIALI
ncbi:type I restriction-modification system subunit M, partial [Acinetobacter baumannii]